MRIAAKEYVSNTLRNCFTFNNFFAWEHFYIDFPLLNKHFKYKDQVCTICDDCNWFFNVKMLLKNNYQNESSRIVIFY